MKVYTKTGDKGETGLIKDRVSKAHPRIHIIGMLDDVMVQQGILLSSVEEKGLLKKDDLRQVYKTFFIIQSKLADVNNQYGLSIEEEYIDFLEQAIDLMDEVLPKLKNFIYYTGHTESLIAHKVRTKIRNVERLVVHLNNEEKIDSGIMIYLNRSSDYFYTLARYINFVQNIEEEIINL